jgi:hypothetical protein
MSANLIIGSSHAVQFVQAVGELRATWEEAEHLVQVTSADGRKNADFIYTTNRPHFLAFRNGAQGELLAEFSPFVEKVRQFDRAKTKIVFCIGGNEHNIRFLCAHPKPFDFVHPSSPTIEAGRQIIPLAVMRETLRSSLERTLLVTRLIAEQAPRAQRFYLAPPPPIPSDAHMRSSPEVFDFSRHEIERASVRLKIYRVYLEILAAFCAERGLTYLPPRTEHCDEQGFLAEAFWAGSTHASPEYYHGLVSELGL